MINRKNLLYITVFVGVIAYAMKPLDSLLDIIRGEMGDIYNGVPRQDVELVGHAAISLLARKGELQQLTIQDIEGADASLLQQPSPFMRSFFYDLIIIGNAELLDIFLEMFHRSYPNLDINWRYVHPQRGYYTMLDKALQLKAGMMSSGSAAINNIEGIITVLIEHGGEKYESVASRNPADRRASTGTPTEEFQ